MPSRKLSQLAPRSRIRPAISLGAAAFGDTALPFIVWSKLSSARSKLAMTNTSDGPASRALLLAGRSFRRQHSGRFRSILFLRSRRAVLPRGHGRNVRSPAVVHSLLVPAASNAAPRPSPPAARE